MSKKLEIPGYSEVIAGKIYQREAEDVRPPLDGLLYPATKLLQVKRYRTYSRDEIIYRIRSDALRILENPIENNEDSFGFGGGLGYKTLEEAINKTLAFFPQDELERISGGEKYSIEHLIEHCKIGNYKPGEFYLQMLSGDVPNVLLDDSVFGQEELDEKGYETIIRKIDKNLWGTTIRLDGEKKMPDKSVVEYLLNRSVTDCDIFTFLGNRKNYPLAVEHIKSMYDALKSPEDVEKIQDYSRTFLETRAFATLDETLRCITEQQIINLPGITGNLPEGIIKEILENMFGQKKKEKKGGPDFMKRDPFAEMN